MEKKALIYINQDFDDSVVDNFFEQLESQNFIDADVIEIRINSNGGYVSEGLYIYDFLTTSDLFEGKIIRTVAIGTVASIATIVWLAGQERLMTPSSLFGFHLPSISVYDATKEELLNEAANAQRVEDIITEIYQQHNLDLKLLKNITFLTAKECKASGLATGIIQSSKIRTEINLSLFQNYLDVNKNQNKNNMKKTSIIRNFLNLFKNEFKNMVEKSLADGTPIMVEMQDETQISVGDIVSLADGSIPPVGEHILADGSKIVTDSEGVITEVELFNEIEALKAKLKEYEEKEKMKNEIVIADEEKVDVVEQEIQMLKKENEELKNLMKLSLSTSKKFEAKKSGKVEVEDSESKTVAPDFRNYQNVERLLSAWKAQKKK